MEFSIIAAYRSVGIDEDKARADTPEFKAPANYKDPDKIFNYEQDKRNEWLGTLSDNIYLSELTEIHLTILTHEFSSALGRSVVKRIHHFPLKDTTGAKLLKWYHSISHYMIDLVTPNSTFSWYGVSTRYLAKRLAVTAAKNAWFSDMSIRSVVLPQLIYAANHFEVDKLLCPSGVSSEASLETKLDQWLGAKTLTRKVLLETLTGGEVTVEAEVDAVYSLFESAGVFSPRALIGDTKRAMAAK